jgi:nitrate/nitrite transport system substrate-binding protein
MRLGFIALTDAAPVIMAQHLGFYARRGLRVELVRQASWPAMRDGLLGGEIDAAHCLASLPFSVAAGVTGRSDQFLPVAMVLNANGQAVTLTLGLSDPAYVSPHGSLGQIAQASRSRRLTLAMTYPGGTHDILLRYWLKAAGVARDAIDLIPIPPPQMVANLAAGTMDGFSVGEPWNAVAVGHGIGFTAIGSGDIVADHPEKVLVVSPRALARRPGEVRELVAATLAACAWLDDRANRRAAVPTLALPQHVNAPGPHVEGRLLGTYELGGGLGTRIESEHPLTFHGGGSVNAPRRAHGLWFLAQMHRLGLLRSAPAYEEIVDALVLRDLYEDVARAEGVPVPDDDMAPFTVALDGAAFDPAHPGHEAARDDMSALI